MLLQCAVCGAKNRVPPEKLAKGLQPVCGRCKSPLSADGKPIEVTDATFTDIVERSPLPVLVDLWAPWCGPCRTVGPIVDSLAGELAGRMRVAKLNVDDNPVISSRFNVQSIPTLLVFRNGGEVARIIGAQPKSAIERQLQPFI